MLFYQASGQETSKNPRIGFDILIGSQLIFPFNNLNYSHTQIGYRVRFNYPLKTGRFSYELQIEPSLYKAEHKMLNPNFFTPADGPDYLQKREYFMQKRTLMEYALNIGIVSRYSFNGNWSIYLLISTGPEYIDAETERLAKGFTFSNLISFGIGYSTGKVRFEFGPGIRHVSNASTHLPNGGHNGSTLDAGVTYSFGK